MHVPAYLWNAPKRSDKMDKFTRSKTLKKCPKSIARMDSGMVGNETEASKKASHFETSTSSHSKSCGQRWELDPLPVHLC